MTGIVILNYNNYADLVNCVDSVFSFTPMNMMKLK